MTNEQIQKWVARLKARGVGFYPGLTEEETRGIEQRFQCKFPPDLALFLQTALPGTGSFPHWRYGLNSDRGARDLQRRLDWPLEGLLFDLRHNKRWPHWWGPEPDSLAEKERKVTAMVAKAPTLIPVYGHRYLPDFPQEVHNPVYSVYQSDIIYYGRNLAHYFQQEFGEKTSQAWRTGKAPKAIPFWEFMVG